MFLRQTIVLLGFFLAGCASATEPPVQQVAEVEQPVIAIERQSDIGEHRRPRYEPSAIETATTASADSAIVQQLISESRVRYRGNCACPDDRDRAGRRCGAR